MDALSHWVAAHALLLLVGLIALIGLAAFAHWRGRPPWSDDLPVPMLHHRTAGVVAFAAIGLFGALALAIESQRGIVALDQRLTDAVAARLGPDLLRIVAGVSEFGAPDVVTALAVLVALGLLLSGHRLLGVAWAATVLGGAFLIGLFKTLFERPRPLHEHGFALETTWSFPSGHAGGSIVFYGMLAYVLMVRLPPRWHRLVLACAATAVLSIGASRVLLQVHYLSDVLAGYAMGLAWLSLAVALTEFLRGSHQPRPADPPPPASE